MLGYPHSRPRRQWAGQMGCPDSRHRRPAGGRVETGMMQGITFLPPCPLHPDMHPADGRPGGEEKGHPGIPAWIFLRAEICDRDNISIARRSFVCMFRVLVDPGSC